MARLLSHRLGILFAAAALLGVAAVGVGQLFPSAPSQPDTGPGGRDYAHASMSVTRYGEGELEYWLFEPADPSPESAPVVVFMHGWAAMSPRVYGAWIEHLVRKGHVVIYPRYQRDIFTPMEQFTDNAISALKDAFNTLRLGGHVRADETKVVYVGHSMGGLLAVNLAIIAAENRLPVPKAVMSNQPGVARRPGGVWGLPMMDLARFPKHTLLLTTAGDRDHVTGDRDALWVHRSATSVPADRKAVLRFVTDMRGIPPLIADHNAPAALARIDDGRGGPDAEAADPDPPGRRFGEAAFDRMAAHSINAMDTRGYWAVMDRLIEAAFTGNALDDALGRTEAGRSLGAWSDGVPIRPLERVEQ